MPKRTFSTVYSADLAGPNVGVPLLIGAMLGITGLYFDTLLFTLCSAMFTSYAIWNWPLLDSRRVVLQLSDSGADIDGIGRIPWDAIKQVELLERQKKNQSPTENCTLRINLNFPLSQVVTQYAPMLRPNWQRKMIKQLDDTSLVIGPNVLLDSQIEIANAFAWFLDPTKKK